MNKIFTHCLFVVSLLVHSGIVRALSIDEQRELFLTTEPVIATVDEEEFNDKAEALKEYPLYVALRYEWLSENLTRTNLVKQFLLDYKDTRYAHLLRQKWLYWLGKNAAWTDFLANYQDTDKTGLQCYFNWAKYSNGEKYQALLAAKELWLVGKDQPDECVPLFNAFIDSSYFSTELVWQRFSLALRAKNPSVSLALQLKKLLPKSEQKTANLWLKVHNQPELVKKADLFEHLDKGGEIFAHGIDRLANTELFTALDLWNSNKDNFKISFSSTEYIQQRLGLGLAYKGESRLAHNLLSSLTNPDQDARQWRVRTALRQQNWTQVLDAVNHLATEEKQEENWRYWQARALAETGDQAQATKLFTELAQQKSLYGFLAADKIQAPYPLEHKPVPLTNADIEALGQKLEFKIVAELIALGREDEAKRHWWFNVKRLEPKQIMAAAKLAQQWNLTQLAAFTIAKAKYWDDLELRFPIAYQDQIFQYAGKQSLDPAVVFGLVRQESVFDVNAGSEVGARGLMQIMPATGKQIARELNDSWLSASSLYDPDINLKYGIYYYKQLVDKFDGSFALAAAGYNAGPHRVKLWRPEKVMPMDIWIETIPFDETRKYVGIVLSNALFYQQRINRNVLKVRDLMPQVQPG